ADHRLSAGANGSDEAMEIVARVLLDVRALSRLHGGLEIEPTAEVAVRAGQHQRMHFAALGALLHGGLELAVDLDGQAVLGFGAIEHDPTDSVFIANTDGLRRGHLCVPPSAVAAVPASLP